VYTRILTFAALVLVLSVPGWAQDNCSAGEGATTCSFSPNVTTGIYEFGSQGRLVVQFETVLTSFNLTVDITNPASNTLPLDPSEFPAGTACVQYVSVTPGLCVQYNFSGTAGGPNQVPVKNTDYKGLITLTLSYLTVQTVHLPAFGHAPGDITTFTENILTSYSTEPSASDPTMGGKTPGLSSVIALDEPLADNGNDTFCGPATAGTVFVPALNFTTNPQGQKSQLEVTFKVVNGANCSATGARDKTASLSVGATDSGGNLFFPPLRNVEGNKFHWDNKNALNEYDISLDGLVSGQTYFVTVFSSKFSPQTVTFVAP
jgi:hypothetical protein